MTMRKSIFIMLLVLITLLSGCSDVSTAPTENDDNELVTETEVTAETESTGSSSFSESKESEAPEMDTELETKAEVIECEPIQSENPKQAEPLEQTERPEQVEEVQQKEVPTPAVATPRETVTPETPPETTSQPAATPTDTAQPEVEETTPIEPTATETPTATESDCDAVADKVAEYLNSYRSSPAEKLTGLTGFAKYRSGQLVSNFAHDTADQRAAATALQYGTYIDPTLYGIEGDPYYEVAGMEAIAYGSYIGSVNEIAEKFALQIYNSGSHWSYVGSGDYHYMGVGVAYRNGTWYCCIMVTRENTDTN